MDRPGGAARRLGDVKYRIVCAVVGPWALTDLDQLETVTTQGLRVAYCHAQIPLFVELSDDNCSQHNRRKAQMRRGHSNKTWA